MKVLAVLVSLVIGASTLLADNPSPTPAPMSWVNQKLQESLADTINKATTAAGEAKDFVIQQMPDVIKQLLAWKFAESLLPIVFFGLLALFMAWRIAVMIKYGDLVDSKTSSYSYHPAKGWPTVWWNVVKMVIGLIFFIGFLTNLNLTWLQIWLAPKVYLIEYTKTLVTGH